MVNYLATEEVVILILRGTGIMTMLKSEHTNLELLISAFMGYGETQTDVGSLHHHLCMYEIHTTASYPKQKYTHHSHEILFFFQKFKVN